MRVVNEEEFYLWHRKLEDTGGYSERLGDEIYPPNSGYPEIYGDSPRKERNPKLTGMPGLLVDSFEETLQISRAVGLATDTTMAVCKTRVYKEGFQTNRSNVLTFSSENKVICFFEGTSFEAARRYVKNGRRIGVLNFANPLEPGGGVFRGAAAQEECLCRSSNLFPCLIRKDVLTDYYKYNKDTFGWIASDRVIYSPGITVFKSDDKIPRLLSKDAWFQVDILTCAAPYYPKLPHVTEEETLIFYKKRICNIFEVAADNQISVLILGAFGCGAFQNPPSLMARAFCETIREEKFHACFKSIVFAIPNNGGVSSRNLSIFRRVFNRDCMDYGQEKEKDKTAPLYGEKYLGKYFSILGDSISTYENFVPNGYKVFYEGETRKKSGVCDVLCTWWGQAVHNLGGHILVDNAWSGSRVTPFPGSTQCFPSGCSRERTGGLHLGTKIPDVIIVFLGFNDWANAVPLYPEKAERGMKAAIRNFFLGEKEQEARQTLPPTFFEAYESILKQIRMNYPSVELWCCTMAATCLRDDSRWLFPYEYAGVHIAYYNDVIRNLAPRYGAGVIDFAAFNVRVETIDGSHPTAQGMQTLASMVIRTLNNQ